jgi:transposase
MEWLRLKQEDIERRLAERHLKDGDLVFLDTTSSYYHGWNDSFITRDEGNLAAKTSSSLVGFKCFQNILLRFAHFNYSLFSDDSGRPIGIEALPFNASNSSIFFPAAEKIKKNSNLFRVVIVGDKESLSDQIKEGLMQTDRLDWIGAIPSSRVKNIVAEGGFQFGQFDDLNLREFTSPEYPGERLIAIVDYKLKARREKAREALIKRAMAKLDVIVANVKSGQLTKEAAIGLAVKRVLAEGNARNLFILKFADGHFSYSRDEESINKNKPFDGLSLIRTSLPVETISPEDCVKRFKNLETLENAFPWLNFHELCGNFITYNLLDDRIRAHLFLIMLAYYVEWHMREAWRELIFGDPELAANKMAQDSVKATNESKKASKSDSKYIKVYSFNEILISLCDVFGVHLSLKNEDSDKPDISFSRLKKLAHLQKKAFYLLKNIPVYSSPANKNEPN